jgi:hypothetical protein
MLRLLESLRSEKTSRATRRAAKPGLEGLEDRKLLYATLGGSWAFGSRITYSFAPDGTSVGGVPSNLYSTLNTVATTATWQQAFQRAAAIWSSYANINIAQVSDNGTQFGDPGNQQGDPRFGDIRIAMIPQSYGVLGFTALPPPYNGGTAAGDIVFNSNVRWQVNTDNDIQTVAMHELGHALGLDHTPIATVEMYPYYNGVKQTLASDDQLGVQSIYGAFPADPIPNGTFNTAQNITGLIDSWSQINLGNQRLAGTSDLDYYSVTVPWNTTGKMTVSMQSTNLSSVSPRVTVFNGAGIPIGSTSLPNSFGATATYTVNVLPGQTYFIRANAASALGSYGAFGLSVNFGPYWQPPIAPPSTVVYQQPDRGSGAASLLGDTGTPPGSSATGFQSDGIWNKSSSSSQSSGASDAVMIQVGTFKAYGDFLALGATPGGNWVHRVDTTGWSLPKAPGQGTNGSSNGSWWGYTVPWIGSTPVSPWTAPQQQAFDTALTQLGHGDDSNANGDDAGTGLDSNGNSQKNKSAWKV